jgi:hypothetical protein
MSVSISLQGNDLHARTATSRQDELVDFFHVIINQPRCVRAYVQNLVRKPRFHWQKDNSGTIFPRKDRNPSRTRWGRIESQEGWKLLFGLGGRMAMYSLMTSGISSRSVSCRAKRLFQGDE